MNAADRRRGNTVRVEQTLKFVQKSKKKYFHKFGDILIKYHIGLSSSHRVNKSLYKQHIF